jgi:hypothetical protein
LKGFWQTCDGRLKEEYMTRDEKINFHNELAAAVSGLKKL